MVHAYKGVQGSSFVKVYDITAASTGKNERMLQQKGRTYGKEYFVAKIHPQSHVTYYPGGFTMTLKLIFSKEGTILGAQIMGHDGVKARIDTLAAALRNVLTTEDLADLELSYAPPYGATKDPVNLAGYIAEKICQGLVEFVSISAIPDLVENGAKVLDIRRLNWLLNSL
jgi:hypothetical protein